jgi:hypothetical protein
MESTQQTPSQLQFGAGPVLDMYFASMNAWKKNCDAFVQASRERQVVPNVAQNPPAAYENTSAQPQKAGEDIFRRFVEHQIELCRFFGKRWEQYLNLPSDLSRCQSAADFAQVQSAFLTKMAADYGIEGRRLGQAFQELLPNWMAAAPVSVIPRQPTHH